MRQIFSFSLVTLLCTISLISCSPRTPPPSDPVAIVVPPPSKAKSIPQPPPLEIVPPVLSEEELTALWVKASAYAPEHEVLEDLVGNYTTKAFMYGDTGEPAEESKGEAHVTPLFDGRFIREEFSSTSGGSRFEGVGIFGYDTLEEHYTYYWIDSMNTAPVIMHGTYTPETKTFTWVGTQFDTLLKKPVKIRAYTKLLSPSGYSFELLDENSASGTTKTVLFVTYEKKKK